MNHTEKIEKILERVKLERGHIGIIGSIEFNVGYAKIEDISIFEDGTMKYTIGNVIHNRTETSYLHLKNYEIIDNIFKKINENKFL